MIEQARMGQPAHARLVIVVLMLGVTGGAVPPPIAQAASPSIASTLAAGANGRFHARWAVVAVSTRRWGAWWA